MDHSHKKSIWDTKFVGFNISKRLALSKGLRLFVGGIGISRNLKGAEKYFESCVEA